MNMPFHRASRIILILLISTTVASAWAQRSPRVINIETPASPPEWALWERYLLDSLYPAAMEFVNRYTSSDGSLIWRDRWPGMDGSDDGYESFHNFPLYYVLGGPEEIHTLSRELWDAVTEQFTEYGQIHNEFDAYYDWMHHGESYIYIYYYGLADPSVAIDRKRALDFAAMYMGEDPEAPNWDGERKLIRSPINGSRGPRFENSAEDWVTHRPVLANYPLPFDDIPHVDSSSAWIDDEKFPYILEALNNRMMRGDVPLNLTATSLITHAYLYTGEEKYRRWVLDYVDAWRARWEANGRIMPDNVGLSGTIGENMEGRWWGGYYGWRWPHGLMNILESTTIAAGNALLLSGDTSYLDIPRSQIELVLNHARTESGETLVPHKYDREWYAHRPLEPRFPINLWYLSQDEEDSRLVDRITDIGLWNASRYKKHKGDSGNEAPWLNFIRGNDPAYPVEILKATWRESLRRLDMIRADTSHVNDQDVHHWQQRNPVVVEGLVQLMLGGPNHIYHGGLLHSRVRYFDPAARRPGVPPDVAALVEKVEPESITLTLVNLHPTETREVIVQAGAFGEHAFTVVQNGTETHTVNDHLLRVHLGEGAVGTMEIGMQRYINRPSYRTPWE